MITGDWESGHTQATLWILFPLRACLELRDNLSQHPTLKAAEAALIGLWTKGTKVFSNGRQKRDDSAIIRQVKHEIYHSQLLN